MGREIRMVPPDWDHPKVMRHYGREGYQPMRDQTVQEAFEEWQTKYLNWLGGEHDRIIEKCGAADYPKNETYRAFCKWTGQPPDPEYYRPDWPEESMTWFQVYETVSEGTPVTPPFATKEELIEYLVAHGDFWDQKRRAGGQSSMKCDPWERESAERFVNGTGWAPSMIVQHNGDGTAEIKTAGHGL